MKRSGCRFIVGCLQGRTGADVWVGVRLGWDNMDVDLESYETGIHCFLLYDSNPAGISNKLHNLICAILVFF